MDPELILNCLLSFQWLLDRVFTLNNSNGLLVLDQRLPVHYLVVVSCCSIKCSRQKSAHFHMTLTPCLLIWKGTIPIKTHLCLPSLNISSALSARSSLLIDVYPSLPWYLHFNTSNTLDLAAKEYRNHLSNKNSPRRWSLFCQENYFSLQLDFSTILVPKLWFIFMLNLQIETDKRECWSTRARFISLTPRQFEPF